MLEWIDALNLSIQKHTFFVNQNKYVYCSIVFANNPRNKHFSFVNWMNGLFQLPNRFKEAENVA